MKLISGILLLVGIATHAMGAAAVDPKARAKEIFERLTGVPLLNGDARLDTMANAISDGKEMDAAAIAVADKNFYTVTLRNWAGKLDGREETSLNPFTDYQALLIGTVRDNRDFRTVLTGNVTYNGKTFGTSYSSMDNPAINLFDELRMVSQVSAQNPAPVGVFTTRAWASNHYDGGTNRRAVEYTFKEFLCAPISQWKDAGLPEDRIRRDVDRAPSGNVSNYQNLCRTCHAGMDALSGAFARYDYVNGTMVYSPNEVAPKYKRNAQTYPEGYIPEDDSFVNYSTQHHNVGLGWRGPLEGSGLLQFATMISNARGFSTCMVQRAFSEVCGRAPGAGDANAVNALVNDFEANGYNLKTTFQSIAISPNCAINP